MATQMQMIQALIDKIEHQAQKTARLQDAIEQEEKRTKELDEILREERDLRKVVDERNADLQHERNCWRLQASTLSSKLEDALLIIEPLSLAAPDDFVDTYRDMAVDFVQKWGMQPGAYGLVELYPEKAEASNGG